MSFYAGLGRLENSDFSRGNTLQFSVLVGYNVQKKGYSAKAASKFANSNLSITI